MTTAMTTLPATDEHDDGGLAARIRIATADAHRAAEHAPFVQDLLAGRLPVEEYARLVAQHEAIYRVLEALVAANRDPTLAPFFVPELVRLPALEADLAFLAGDDWRERLTLVEATRDYCDHLRGLATSWPRGLLAHHYVRYLGDLSGGQVIGRVLQRVYGFADGQGTAFYRFPAIASAKAHKVRYRQLLDDLAWDATDQARLIAEASVAYRLNADVFFELGPLPRLAGGAHPRVGNGTCEDDPTG